MESQPIKVKIVKVTMIRAVDENGKYHKISNYQESTNSEEIVFEEVNGILSSEWKQDKYTDGSFARSETEHTKFKITDELNY